MVIQKQSDPTGASEEERPLSRAQRALLRAQQDNARRESAQRTGDVAGCVDRASRDVDGQAVLAEKLLDELVNFPGITFIACATIGEQRYTEVGPELGAAVELAYHLRHGHDVEGGFLRRPTSTPAPDGQGGADVAQKMEAWLGKLRNESGDFIVAWHVAGLGEVHLNHSEESEVAAFDRVRDLLLDEVWWNLA